MICYDSDSGSLFNSRKSSEETSFREGELFLSCTNLVCLENSSNFFLHVTIHPCHVPFCLFLSSLSCFFIFYSSLLGRVRVFLSFLFRLYLDFVLIVFMGCGVPRCVFSAFLSTLMLHLTTRHVTGCYLLLEANFFYSCHQLFTFLDAHRVRALPVWQSSQMVNCSSFFSPLLSILCNLSLCCFVKVLTFLLIYTVYFFHLVFFFFSLPYSISLVRHQSVII